MIGTIINYIKIQRILRKIYKAENIEKNLSDLFGVPCKKDWVGRLYMVINPIIQDIESGGNTLVYNSNETVIIEGWVMKNLELIRKFVVNNSLFDLLTYSIDKIDDDDNYLVVFKNIYFDTMKQIVIWSLIILSFGVIAGIILL